MTYVTLEVKFGVQKPIRNPNTERSVSTSALSKRASKDISFSLINKQLIRLYVVPLAYIRLGSINFGQALYRGQ